MQFMQKKKWGKRMVDKQKQKREIEIYGERKERERAYPNKINTFGMAQKKKDAWKKKVKKRKNI